MRRVLSASMTVVFAVALAVAVQFGTLAIASVLGALVVVLASGWPTLLGLPTPRGSTTVLALCGATAVVVVLVTIDNPTPPLHWLAPVLAISIVVGFMHQLLRRDLRPRLVDSLTGVLAGVVVVECAAGWLAAFNETSDAALVGLAALGVTAVAMALPLRRVISESVAAVAAIVVSIGAAQVIGQGSTLGAVVVGVMVAVLMIAFDLIYSRLPSVVSRQAAVAVGASNVCAAGMVIYMVGSVAS